MPDDGPVTLTGGKQLLVTGEHVFRHCHALLADWQQVLSLLTPMGEV